MRSIVGTLPRHAARRTVLSLVITSMLSASAAVAPATALAVSAASADLSLHAETDRDVVPVGDDFSLTVTVTNAGPDATDGVVVSAPLPVTWIFVGADPAAEYDADTGTWDVGALADGETKVLELTATMNNQGLLFLRPEVTASTADDPDSTPGNCCSDEDDEAFVGVNGALEADLSLTMVVDDPAPGVGTNVTFTLKLGNAGPNHVSGVGVKDVLPTNMTFVAATPSGEYDPGTAIWNVPPVAPGDSASLDIVARVDDSTAATNYAEIFISSFIDHDSIRGNNSTDEDDDDSVTVTGQAVSADLRLHAGGSPNLHPTIGGPAGVQVVVTNDGPDTATNVVVRDNLASLAEFDFDSADSAQSGADYDFATGTWNVGSLESGASEVLEVHLTPTAAGEPQYRVEIIHSSVHDPDSTPGNADTNGVEDDAAQFGFLVRGSSTDLSLTKTVDDPSPAAGQDVTFTITVRNDGPYPVLGVSVLDLLPPGLTFVSAVPPLNTDYDSITGMWGAGNLGPGDTAVLLITASKTGAGPVTNRAEIATADLDDPDSTPGNGSTDEDDDDTVTVGDDDVPTISIADRDVNEGNDATTPATFTVTLSAASGNEVTVDWRTVDGTASAGEDYAFATGTATFAAGTTTATVQVDVLGDLLDEFGESFTVELSNPVNATITGGIGTGTIRDDDAPPTVSIADVTVAEGNGGTTPATFTVTLSGPSGKAISVDYATSDVSTAAGEDYAVGTGTVDVPPGATSGQLTVAVTGDTTFEATETFRVNLSSAVNATILAGAGAATGFITNDDAAPAISIGDVSLDEGDAGTATATFHVMLSAASGLPVTVAWSTAGATALVGEDFGAAAGVLAFDPGDVDEPIAIDVYGDTRFEPDETFTVELSTPTGATIDDGTGVATIRNDDPDLAADVAIAKSADHNTSDNPVLPGGYLVYTLTVTNAGPGTATDIQVSDTLPRPSTPGDARWCEGVAPATSCDTTAGQPYGSATAIPAIPALGSGQTRRFQIGYTVAASGPSGTMQNTVSIAASTADPGPANNTSSVTVLVDVPPIASFTFGPAAPITGDLVRFDGSGSSDTDTIPAYAWDFGDGTVGTGPMPTHVYSRADRYNVTLTVTDGVGGTASTAQLVDVRNPGGPPANRVLRGTVTQLLPFAPGGDPATGRVPLAGALVSIGTGRQPIAQATTDAQGRYVFTNLNNCSPCPVVVTAAGQQLAQAGVTLQPSNPGTTVRDFTVGTLPDQLFVTGRVVPPPVFPGDPGPADPATVAIRVTAQGLTVDSASLGGPGGFGAYQLLLGRLGGKGGLSPGGQLRVTLFENGTEVGHVFVQVPQASGGAALLMTAADLVGQDPPPSANRVLRGTVTQLLPFAPGGDPATGRVPLAGALVSIGTGRQPIAQATTDAQGRYVFTNLNNCSPCPVVVTAAGQQLAQAGVTLQPSNPGTTVRDFTVGTLPDQLFVTGRVVPPPVFPGDPGPADPATVAIRVTAQGLTVDSASLGGPGGFGAYQLLLGRLGGKGGLSPGGQLRVTLFENGTEVGHVFVQVPQASGGAALVMTAADLVGQDPPPSANRVLRGTVTQLLPFAPGGDPATGRVPLAGALVSIGTGRQPIAQATTDAQGRYVFTNLNNCSPCPVVVTAAGQQLAQAGVTLQPSNPGTTVRDFTVGTLPDQLFVTGRVVPPPVFPGDPGPADPATVAIRVTAQGLTVDSASLGGPGGFGAYQLLLGRLGGKGGLSPGGQLRVTLFENGTEVGHVFVQVPQASGGAALLMTAADLVGQ